LTRPFSKERTQKHIQQCSLVEYFSNKIFNLISVHVEKLHQARAIPSEYPETLTYYTEYRLGIYMSLILNQIPHRFLDYFTDQTTLLYTKTAENPHILVSSDSLKLVKFALDFFKKKLNLSKVSKIVDNLTEKFEMIHQDEHCGEILQFRAEFLKSIAEGRYRKRKPRWYLGKERYLWMAGMDFKKASFHFKEAGTTEKYKNADEMSSSIFRNFSQTKEDYMFSIRPFTSEETTTNLYVDTGYEDELKSIIDLTDGGNYAIIGPRGSGKSTVINRILKEYVEKENFMTLKLEAPRRYNTLEFHFIITPPFSFILT
jgi:ABC-type multidrug transport system fused ATPase/permease subunit